MRGSGETGFCLRVVATAVVSALDFQTLIPSLIPVDVGLNFLLPSAQVTNLYPLLRPTKCIFKYHMATVES